MYVYCVYGLPGIQTIGLKNLSNNNIIQKMYDKGCIESKRERKIIQFHKHGNYVLYYIKNDKTF